MKKLYIKEKYIRFQKKVRRKARKRRIRKCRRTLSARRQVLGMPRLVRKRLRNSRDLVHIDAPENLSLINNPEKTIIFINKIHESFLLYQGVFVNLKEVVSIDHSAITVLLSVLHKFRVKRMRFSGNLPLDAEVAKKLVISEFFKMLHDPESATDDNLIEVRENRIYARANRFVVPELGEKIMEQATVTIFGEKRLCKALQRTLLELMQNTNNHASTYGEGGIHWWLSVNHDTAAKKVHFYFVDYGQGVLKSITNSNNPNIYDAFITKAKELLRLNNGPEVIRSVFAGEHRNPVSRNHPYYRGKGLPSILEATKKNQISGLCFITNDTVAKPTDEVYSRLNVSFIGTFVHWELNERNFNIPWTL